MQIDSSFDFRSDAGAGRDPDKYSPTLRRYHRLLWSKPLPCGRPFQLNDNVPGAYLRHRSELGDFSLSSDSVMPTFNTWKSMAHILDTFPKEEVEEFNRITYTIGGMMIFPANTIDGKQTINGARGFNRKIADRFDLTVECIRRYYAGQSSPLGETLARYPEFFALFGGFAGYVDFFLLQDLLTADRASVRFFMPFDDFTGPAVPTDVNAYKRFRDGSIEFVTARNRRIDQHASRAS